MTPLSDVQQNWNELGGDEGTACVEARLDARSPAVPAFVALDDRVEYLAGWMAGSAAARLAGPLPDELAREVVALLETTAQAISSLASKSHEMPSTFTHAG